MHAVACLICWSLHHDHKLFLAIDITPIPWNLFCDCVQRLLKCNYRCLIWIYMIDSLFYHTHCVPDHRSRFWPFEKERQENWNVNFFFVILIFSMIRPPRNVAWFSISSCHYHIFHVFKPTMRTKLLIYKHQSNSLGFKTPQHMPCTFIHRYYTSFLVSIYFIK